MGFSSRLDTLFEGVISSSYSSFDEEGEYI